MSDMDGLLVEFTEPEPEPARADGLLVQFCEGWDSANDPRPPYASSITIGVTNEQLGSATRGNRARQRLSSGTHGGAEVQPCGAEVQPGASAETLADEEAIARLQARTEASREDVQRPRGRTTGGAPAVLRPGRGHGAQVRETV